MLLAFDWTQLAQQIVIGLASGGVWATLAVALVLIYRSTGVVNFAQGEMAMFSTFIAWSLVDHGLSYWAAFLLTVAISFVGGVAIERAVIRPVERAPVLTVVIVTLGLFFLVNGAARWLWSPETRSLPNAFSTRPIEVAGVAFSIQDLGTIGVSLGAVALLWAFFRFTKLGLASRAAAVNPDASRLLGVRVSWMLALGWGLAAALGAVSGMLTAPALASFDQNLMQPVLLYAFAGAVLGGLDSPFGAVVGTLLLGVLINLVGTYVDWVGTSLRLPFALAVILGVLLVRPEGLFGHASARRV
jgi:branched-chain amino acid transport system permease protein